MDYSEIREEFDKTIQEIAQITGKTEEDIKAELENTEDMEELLKRATEIFNE